MKRQRQRWHSSNLDRPPKTAAFIAFNLCFAEGSLLKLQHRVRSASRRVPYRHDEDTRARRKFQKFYFPTDEPVEEISRRESWDHKVIEELYFADDNELAWSFLIDASQEEPKNGRRRKAQKSTPSSSTPFTKGLRRLYQQFVGAAIHPTVVNNQTNANKDFMNGDAHYNDTYKWNVTAAVDFNSTVDSQAFNQTSSVVYTAADNPPQPIQFQPIRIRAILAESSGAGNLLTPDQRTQLFEDMLSPALLAWSSALRVDPVVGNLTVDVTQLLDGQTCGPGKNSELPSVQVPLEHITKGIPDTDMVIYLSLGFTAGASIAMGYSGNFSSPSNGTSPPTLNVGIGQPKDNSSTAFLFNSSKISAPDSGWEMDESLFLGNTTAEAGWILGLIGNNSVSASLSTNSTEWSNISDSSNATSSIDLNTTNPINAVNWSNVVNLTQARICRGDYLAAASFCSSDQYDRPTAAMLHICVDESFFDPSKKTRNILTLMHELGHALGFNSLSMAHFRHPDGSPITPRVNGEIPDTKVQCTGPTTDQIWGLLPLPSENILQFRTVRGGVRVAQIVTPSVVQVVRNQFDCQSLEGAELESAVPLVSTIDEPCIGSHWERRLFSSDLMNPIIDDLESTSLISTLTLAYFADSGWYQVDLSMADVAAGWGRGTGCGFVQDECIGKNGQVPPQNQPFFCNEIPSAYSRSVASDIHGCTPDLSRKALCSIGRYDLALPQPYQYFLDTYGSDVGGNDPYMDYCPVYSGFVNGLCSSTDDGLALQASPIERFGIRNSRCLVGNLHSQSKTALCLPIACVVEDRSFRVNVGGVWQVCSRANQVLKAAGDTSFSVVCPDPRRICPTFFCPYDCLGTGGVCDYSTGDCVCQFDGPNNSTFTNVCGSFVANETEPPTGLFLHPLQPQYFDYPVMPNADSPLSDYYYVTTRALQSENNLPRLDPWKIGLACLGGVIVVSTFLSICFWFFCRWTKSGTPNIWFRRSVLFEHGIVENDGIVVNREKDKMIATVLVDLRIHDPARRTRMESFAETECNLTESEASAAAGSECHSEASARSESMSEPDSTQGYNLDEIEGNEMHAAQVVIRRRAVHGRVEHIV